MTTKPRAKKFRIRRTTNSPSDTPRRPSAADAMPSPTASPVATGNAAEQLFAPADADDGFGKEPFPTAAAATQNERPKPTAVPDQSMDEAIAEIRREGLTGRQLRMARRVAQKHGIAPTSDFDAVRLLRLQGIDPFHREA